MALIRHHVTDLYRRWGRPVSALVSVTVLIAAVGFTYAAFHQYDWGHPFTKLIGFMLILGLLLLLRRNLPTEQRAEPNTLTRGIEILGSGALLIWIALGWGARYLPDLPGHPRVDVGYTTLHAATGLWQRGENPYTRTDLNPRPELAEWHRGFHYGPMMLVGYAAAAVDPLGYKLTSLVCILIVLLGVVWICVHPSAVGDKALRSDKLSAALFVVTVMVLGERFWFELFTQGVSDIFPVALLVLGLIALQRQRWFLCGLLLGLSFSSKFAPAAFLGILLIRTTTPRALYYGGLAGLAPLFAFALWEPLALFENVFRLRFMLGFDSTSLYSITPEALHPLFLWTQLTAIAACLIYNLFRPVRFDSLLVQFCGLLILVEVTFKEIHANHLIWFMPLVPLALVHVRHQLFAQLADCLRPPARATT